MSSPDYAPDLTFHAGRCGTTYFASRRDARYCAQNTGPSGACLGGVANCEELGQPIWILKSTWLPETSDLLALPKGISAQDGLPTVFGKTSDKK